MKIIAKTTDGVLIEATNQEVKHILHVVYGETPKELSINMKIHTFDYATTRSKIKTLKDEYSFKQLMLYGLQFIDYLAELQVRVDEASKIED